MATKLAKRILKTVNGRLVVVYVDAITGQELSSLDGYTLTTQDGFSNTNTTPPAQTPQPETPVRSSSGRRSNKSENFWTESEWATSPNRSKGTGDIIGDFTSAGKTLQERINNVKSYITNGIMTTVGKVIAGNVTDEQKKQAVQGAKTAVTGAAQGVADKVSGLVGGLFGNNSPTPSATPSSSSSGKLVSPNEMFTYRDIATRNMPLAETYFEQVAAATAAVNPDIRWEISSAGQPHDYHPKNNPVGGTGSTRHNVDENGLGHTADLHPTLNGEKIDYNTNPEVYEQLVTAMATVGFTGIGVDMDKGYLHVGGGAPAVWAYKGNVDIPAPPNIQTAYANGVEANKKGQGEAIKEQYAQQVYGQNKQEAKSAAVSAVSPALKDAVTSYKQGKGQPVIDAPIAQPVVQQAPQAIPQSPINEAFSYTIPQTAPLVQPQVQQAPMVTTSATQVIEEAVPTQQMASLPESNGFVERISTPTAPTTGGDSHLDALLSVINYAEGNPTAKDLFGYGDFDPELGHPNQKVYYNNGADFSTAAGLYQINKATFDDYSRRTGITGFTENDQKELAKAIAIDRYNQATGGDLLKDIQDENNLEGIFDALSGTWSSLPSGSQARTKFDELKGMFTSKIAPTTTASVIDKPVSNFMGTEPVSLSTVTGNSGFMHDNEKNAAKAAVAKAESKSAFATPMGSGSSGTSGVSPSASYAAKAAEKAASAKAASKASSGSSSSSYSSGSSSGGFMGSTTQKVKNTGSSGSTQVTNTNTKTKPTSSGSGSTSTPTSSGSKASSKASSSTSSSSSKDKSKSK